MDDEIRFHLERRAARFEEEGMTPEEARVAAEARFGDVTSVKGEVERTMKRNERAVRKSDTLDSVRRDLSFALRQIVRNPGFSSIAILTIALAIGATTSVFSVVDGIMLRPLPFDEPDELVMVWADYTRRDVMLPDKRREWLSWPNFSDFRDDVPAVEHVAAFGGWGPTLTGVGSSAEQLLGAQVGEGMFSAILDVSPVMGRGFTPDEHAAEGPRAVLLSNGFWGRAFGADPNVLGQTIRLNDQPFTVVGVMSADFHPPPFLGTDVWTPLQMDRTNGGGRGGAFLRAMGRLTDAGALELARTQATQLGLRLENEYPQTNGETGFNVYPLQFDMVQQSSRALWLLLGAVAFVLLIACVNVANLLLSRGASRQSELAVRIAMGAGRRRILTQLMTESLILAAAGGALGAAFSLIGTGALVRLAPAGTPLIEQVTVDARILGFAALVTMVTGAVFGIMPALRASQAEPATVIRAGGRSGGAAGSAGLRNGLVVGQVGLALILLVGAGLLVRSFQNLRNVDLGFDPEGVLAMQVQISPVRYEEATDRVAFFSTLEERLLSVPGVEGVGSITNLPMAGADGDTSFFVEGAAPPESGRAPAVWLRRITPGYMDALGVEIVSGRGFTASDDAETTRVILVNETLERDYFDGQAVGKRLNVNNPEQPIWREIVGVAADIKNFGIRSESRNAMYLPYAQAPTTFLFTAVRTSGVDPASLINPLRAQVGEIDPGVALADIQPMDELVSSSLGADRFTTTLLSGFAVVALLLAVVGLYGVVSYSVNTRLRELGVRIALGAHSSGIRRLVVGWAVTPALGGILVGGIGALAVTRLMEGLLFEVPATDLVTFTAVAVLMAVATIVASLIPAMRATRVDPIRVLKSD